MQDLDYAFTPATLAWKRTGKSQKPWVYTTHKLIHFSYHTNKDCGYSFYGLGMSSPFIF